MHLLIPKFVKFVPSGLQIGFYLERAGRDYVIFERDGLAGIFVKDNGTFNINTSYSKTLFYRLQVARLG